MKLRKQKKQPEKRIVQSSSTRPNSTVFSYHASRSTDQRNIGRHEPSVQRAKPKLDLRYVPTWLSIAVIVFSAMYALTLAANARVTVLTPNTSLTRPASVYQQAANTLLSHSIWSYTKLTVNTESIAQQLQQEFPEVESVAVTVPLLGRRPVITIQTAEPAFLLASTKSGAYYVNNDGRVMVKASDVSVAPQDEVVVNDESGIAIESNKQVLPKDTVRFITDTIKQLRAQNVIVESIELPAVPYEIRVHIKDKPYYVRMNTESDSRQQAGTYLAVKAKLEGEGTTPKEYIDVRVDERAYYK